MAGADAQAVARLHSDSWKSAYRGILRDDYLNTLVYPDREALWETRLANPGSAGFGFVAENGDRLVGFAYAVPHHHPTWGTLLDNLHVAPDMKSRGLGRALLRLVCDEQVRRWPADGLHLLVFEENTNARGFYGQLGAEARERVLIQAPDGGQVAEWLYTWPSAHALLARLLV
jgi:ribosomal protein S18 acetylase RimI-like enzyme